MLDSFNAIMSMSFLEASVGVWAIFLGLVTILLVLDLGVFNRKDHVIEVRESLWFALGYIVIALLFGLWVWMTRGNEDGMNFITAYLIEKSLSLDNLFVISMIFAYFGVPRIYQHRVLFWGIVGVVVMRGILIGFGTALVHNFEWVLLLFAAFLIFTGIKMTLSSDDDAGIEDSKLLKFLQRKMNVTPFLRGHDFFIRDKSTNHKLQATPLFLALVTIELADLLFAVDSIPAVLAITSDTFVVYTSNIFAVLGLRSLYFAVAAMIHRFHYMKYALSIILIFIGLKAFYSHFFDKIPASVSLGITLTLLIGGFVFSMFKTKNEAEELGRRALEGGSTLQPDTSGDDEPKA